MAFRKSWAILGAGLLVCVQPAMGQDEQPPAGAATGLTDEESSLADMFKVEPLTPEQEARLPLAQDIVSKIITPGAMSEMVSGMTGDWMGAMTETVDIPPNDEIASQLGLAPYELSLPKEQAEEIAGILDPSWRERRKRQAEAIPAVTGQMLATMEPIMRKAMSELYAINFSDRELNDISAFFATESGAAYAAKSYTIASDPRMMAAAVEAVPTMMAAIGSFDDQMKAATADLPAPRAFGELSSSQRARIAALTGYSVEQLDSGIAMQESAVDAAMGVMDAMGAMEAVGYDVEKARRKAN